MLDQHTFIAANGLAKTGERDASQWASDLIKLLGLPLFGAPQNSDGKYNVTPFRISAHALAEHFEGNKTIAVQLINDGVGRAIALDIDRDFPRRLSVVASILRQRGLDAAAICTSGSDAGRGKILVFFGQVRAQHKLQGIVRSILLEARANRAWGVEGPNEVTAFPQDGKGGIVRIGGRNRNVERAATCVDAFFSIDGEPAELSAVVPFAETEIVTTGLGQWAQCELESEWNWGASAFRRVLRLCLEARRCFGAAAGKHRADTWRDRVWEQSPMLQATKKGSSSRARRGWDRCWERAWEYACKEHNRISEIIETLSNPGGGSLQERQDNVSGISASQRKILAVLWTYALEKGLSPCAIGISYRQIAAFSGLSLKKAFAGVQHMEEAGHIVIHDRGTQGPKGQKTIVGIVEPGETPASAREKAAKRGNVKRRKQFHSRAKEDRDRDANASSARPVEIAIP